MEAEMDPWSTPPCRIRIIKRLWKSGIVSGLSSSLSESLFVSPLRSLPFALRFAKFAFSMINLPSLYFWSSSNALICKVSSASLHKSSRQLSYRWHTWCPPQCACRFSWTAQTKVLWINWKLCQTKRLGLSFQKRTTPLVGWTYFWNEFWWMSQVRPTVSTHVYETFTLLVCGFWVAVDEVK